MGEIAADLPKARTPVLGLRSLGDDRLSRLAALGDARAFEVVYERHHQALYRYCRSLLGNPEDAADALQSTMASALRGLRGETREIRLKPWLFRIAHNECVSMMRTRRPQTAIDDSLELAAPESDPATRERLRQLVADLRELPESRRGALVMRELSGLSYEEIGSALGCSVQAARQSVFEARSALYELAEGRAMECESVRRALSDNDGRVLRGRRIRSHLRACGACSDFRDLIGARRHDLAAIAPPIPAALAAGLLHQLAGAGAGGGGAGAGGAGLGSLAAGKAAVASGAFKAAAVVAATAALGAGTVETVRHVRHSHPKPAPAVQSSQPATRALKAVATPVPATPQAATTAPRSGARDLPSASRQAPTAPSAKAHHGKPQVTAPHGSPGAENRSGNAPPKPAHPEHPAKPAPGAKTPPQSKKPAGSGAPPNAGNPPQSKRPATMPVVPVTPPQPPSQSNGQGGTDRGQSDLLHGKVPAH